VRIGVAWRGAVLLLALVGPPAAFGQAASTVHGLVVDAGSGIPVAGARIDNLPRHLRSESADNGTFTITAVAGDTLRIRALGYRPADLLLTSAGQLRVPLISAPAILPEVVVTASRLAQRAAETAVPVTVVSADQIAATGASAADKVLAQVPGIQMLPTEPTGADLSIRGIDGARVLVLVDGEPTFGNLLENRDLSRLSTIATERIEVVKGPLSAQYGSDALGGVVNLLTARPSGPMQLSATGRAGGEGRREAQLGVEGGGRFSYRVNGGWREDQSVASVTQPSSALDRVYDIRSTFGFAVTPALDLRADVNLMRERQRWQLSADGFNGFNDNTGGTGWLEAAGRLGAGRWSSRLYFEDYTHRFRQAQGNLPLASDTAPTQTERTAKASVSYANRVGSHGLSGGIDLSGRSIDSPGKVDGAVSDRMLEGYAQDSWTAGQLLVTPATRVSWNSRWGSTVTPSVSAAWELSPSIRWRAAVGRGFRAPSFKELAWDFSNPLAGYIILGNPDLVPERSWQYSTGAAFGLTPHLIADAEFYRNDVHDLIELDADGTDPASGFIRYRPHNVSRARTQGVELGLKWSTGPWLASLGYNYLDAKDRATNQTLDRRATHSGRAAIGRQFAALDGIRADLTFVYTGSAPAAQADGSIGTQAQYLATNAQLRIGLVHGLEASGGVDNLFDARPAGWQGLFGRRYYFGLTTSWQP